MEYPDGVFYYLRPQMHDPIASPQWYTEDAPTLGWGIGALLFSLLVVTRNTAGQIQEAGTGTLILAVVVGTALGCLDALLGQFLRNLAHPDAVYTTGGFFSLVGLRLFWLCGPQLIGLAGGVFLGIALVVH